MKKIFHYMRESAFNLNKKNILNLVEPNDEALILDLGCDDGEWTSKIGKKAQSQNIHGLDIVDKQLEKAQKKGIKTTKGNLNSPLPYKNSYFDCVHANQVIEHLVDIDNFLSEIHRVLKPNGYCIISTENLSSWVNIFSLILGWQPFSLTNISKKIYGIGNPLAINKNQPVEMESWLHVKVMALKALKDFFKLHNLKVEKSVGAGYFPLPAILGKVDPWHSHFITIKARKI